MFILFFVITARLTMACSYFIWRAMEIKPVILILADISGHTRFIKWHRVSLIHAEKIITELLESVIASADAPLVLHELEGV